LMDALEHSDAIEVDYKEAVEEVYSVRSTSPEALVETHRDEGKVGAVIRVEPEVERPDPDMEVCPYCKEEFQND